MTLLFAMFLFNAADEITDFKPIDISPGVQNSALTFYRLIVNFAQSGELEAFENNFLFEAALREFFRNLSRLADDLLPFVFSNFHLIVHFIPFISLLIIV